jgi:hypothetical protein
MYYYLKIIYYDFKNRFKTDLKFNFSIKSNLKIDKYNYTNLYILYIYYTLFNSYFKNRF